LRWKEGAVWCKGVEIADWDGEELEGEWDGGLTTHVCYYRAEMTAG